MVVASPPPRAAYAAAVETLAATVVRAVEDSDDTFNLAEQVERADNRGVGLAALRVLGADALLPFRLELAPWRDEDAETAVASLTGIHLPAADLHHGQSSAARTSAATVPALRDWATAEVLAQLGVPDARRPFPGIPSTLTSAPEAGSGWVAWSVGLAQLSPLAAPGLATPVCAEVTTRALDTARGLSRALLRRDRCTAARLVRWLRVIAASTDTEVAEWAARTGVHVDAVQRHLEVVVDPAEVRTRLELLVGRHPRRLPSVTVDDVHALPASSGASTASGGSVDGGAAATEPRDRWVEFAHRIAARGWVWLEGNVTHFALPDDVIRGGEDANNALKPAAEIAHCASVALRESAGGSIQGSVAPALLAFVWDQLQGGELLAERQRTRPTEVASTTALETYATFARAGYRHRDLDDLLAHQAALRASAVPQEAPERALSLVNARRVCGLPEALPVEAITSTTWIASRPEPWTADLPGLYAMTHAVYHLTDWGARPDEIPTELVEYVQTWLPVWLEVYLEIGHWDIVGELLLVDLCLPCPQTPPEAWERLHNAQRADGLVPAEPGRPMGTGWFAAHNHYHSTVVAVLAASVGLARHLEAPSARTTRRASR